MKALLYVLLLLVFSGCRAGEWKTISIGDYLFDFPIDFKIYREGNPGANLGTIENEDIIFDYSCDYMPKMEPQTIEEYLQYGSWRNTLPYRFMKIDAPDDQLPIVSVLNIRPATAADSTLEPGCDYVANCEHEEEKFEEAIILEEETKNTSFITDTLGSQYRKIYYPKNMQEGISGVYFTATENLSKRAGDYISLSIEAENMSKVQLNLSKEQLNLVLQIFKTGRHK